MQRWDKPNPLNTGLIPRPDGKWVAYTDYEQLMEKAVQFAENIIYVMGALVRTREELEANGHVIASRSFLQSPEVQAWRRERKL